MLENSKKKSKKVQKIRKINSGIIYIQIGLSEAEKERKNFSPEFHSYSTREDNSEKNSKKIEKTKKLVSGIIYSQNGMR